MKENGISQSDIARHLGVSRQAVCLNLGRPLDRIRVGTLETYLHVLGEKENFLRKILKQK